jgi:hypothetical protein
LQAHTVDGVDVYPSASLHSLLPFANILIISYCFRPPPSPTFRHTTLNILDREATYTFAHTLRPSIHSKNGRDTLAMCFSRSHRWYKHASINRREALLVVCHPKNQAIDGTNMHPKIDACCPLVVLPPRLSSDRQYNQTTPNRIHTQKVGYPEGWTHGEKVRNRT